MELVLRPRKWRCCQVSAGCTCVHAQIIFIDTFMWKSTLRFGNLEVCTSLKVLHTSQNAQQCYTPAFLHNPNQQRQEAWIRMLLDATGQAYFADTWKLSCPIPVPVCIKPSPDRHDGLKCDATRRLVGSSRCGADTSTTIRLKCFPSGRSLS